ncbi:hypothetical protein [Zoogloea sp. LCSB751]|uniref:hypothetical protein n=1 Tax=Zoogloea sp. LCSB751 TaxID=1965277 RepID=UPI0009A49364|nr:hypothetical protein [Zoogloea sp. LCSB751]
MSAERRIKYQDLPAEQAVTLLFGVTRDELDRVVLQCWSAFMSVGPLKPKGFGGTNAWAFGTEALRELFVPKGWLPVNPNNQPRVVSPDGKHAITVISGDSDTGNPYREPQTRNKRGSQTLRSVSYNSIQGQLFPVSSAVRRDFDLDSAEGQSLWILLFHVDTGAQEVRYELSRPVNFGDNDKVDGWEPRFIMPALSFQARGSRGTPDDGVDFDIPVTPRS